MNPIVSPKKNSESLNHCKMVKKWFKAPSVDKHLLALEELSTQTLLNQGVY